MTYILLFILWETMALCIYAFIKNVAICYGGRLMDDFDSLGEFICFIIFALLIVAILLQVEWVVKKEIYGTTDCFWKECVTVMGAENE